MPHAQDAPAGRVRDFLQTEAAGGSVLLAAAAAALVWANSPWQAGYREVWHGSVQHWVNDGLMAIFFFVVALEIKRELVTGALRSPRAAALPAVAALGGMAVPALFYAAVNTGQPGSNGWGVPMATDIAFALGVVAVIGRRVPPSLKLFLLSLAIVDDIGAIVVIAIFYASGIDALALLVAVLLFSLILLLRRTGVEWLPVHVALGVGVWFAMYRSGVHATIAGVALGMVVPAGERLEQRLHPWTSFGVVPLFALANAGVTFRSDALDAPGSPRIVVGIVLGLVVGKVVGISGAAWLAVRLGVARLPDGARWGHVVGIAAVAGIGFTVSLFVAGLAFDAGSKTEAAAKIGILIASTAAVALGAMLLRR